MKPLDRFYNYNVEKVKSTIQEFLTRGLEIKGWGNCLDSKTALPAFFLSVKNPNETKKEHSINYDYYIFDYYSEKELNAVWPEINRLLKENKQFKTIIIDAIKL